MFILPKNFKPSKQIEPGETLEVIAEIMLGEDGRYSLGKLDGRKMDGGAEEAEEAEGPEFDHMVRLPSEGLEA